MGTMAHKWYPVLVLVVLVWARAPEWGLEQQWDQGRGLAMVLVPLRALVQDRLWALGWGDPVGVRCMDQGSHLASGDQDPV